jgi:hypothetical protein
MLRTLALAAGLSLAGISGAFAQSFNVSLNGFCNTFTLTVSGFEIYGTRQGCGYTDIDGGSVGKVSGHLYYVDQDTNDSQEIFVWFFTKPKKAGTGDWYLYESTGSAYTFVNSGTYSPTTPGNRSLTTRDVTRK